MAYRRRNYRRKTYRRKSYRRRVRKAKQPTTLSAVSAVAKNGFYLAKKLARWINVEFKYHNNVLTNQLVTNTGSRYHLFSDNATTMGSPLAIGTDEFTRNGVSVKLQNMNMTYQLQMNSSATVQYATVRIMIVKYKNSNQGTFLLGDLLQSVEPIGLRNLDNRFHFNTIYDRTHVLTKGDPRGALLIKKVFKLFGHLHYANALNKVEGDDYAVVILSDQSTAANQPVISMKFRTSFTDN